MSGQTTAQDLSGTCILVLDDDPTMRSLMHSALARHGCERILLCERGQDALDRFRDWTIDLIICDWSMEPMSGLAFLRELHKPERALNVPVIILSASGDPQELALAQDFGIQRWLLKPITLHNLIQQVSATLGQSASKAVTAKLSASARADLTKRYRNRLVGYLTTLDECLAASSRASRRSVIADLRGSSWNEINWIFTNIRDQAGDHGFELIASLADFGWQLTNALLLSENLTYQVNAVTRRITVIVQVMRMVLETHIHGDGGEVGERLLCKIRPYLQLIHTMLPRRPDRIPRSEVIV